MRALLLILALLAAPARAGWTAGAWPACEHVGGREFAPGVLYKQVWALDLFNAIEERARAINQSGTTNLWTAAGVTRPTWWTAAGVTNRVVRFDRAGSSLEDNGTRFLPAAKLLVGVLATYYLDTTRLDPDDLPSAWHDWQLAGGARTNVPTLAQTYTKWVWECPGVNHSEAFTVTEQEDRASPAYPSHSATGLARAVSLPRDYLSVTPFRLLEGFCDPTTAALGPSFVYAGTGQGDSPHAGGNWYWSDFGWDGLRAVLSNMTHRVVVQGAETPVGVGWWWDAADGDNEMEQLGDAQELHRRQNPGPDDDLQAGDLAASLADAAANASPTQDADELTRDPYYIYSHRYYSTLRAEVSDGEEYGCFWATDFVAVKGRPALNRSFSWPPAGVTAAVRYFADVESYTAPAGQSAWTTEELAGFALSTPGTGWTVATNVVSHTTVDSGLLPGDPASTQGLPRGLALEGQDLIGTGFDYDEIPTSPRGNMLRNSKEWRGPFAVIEFTWSYP